MSIYQVSVNGLLQGSGALRNIVHYEFEGLVPDATQRQTFIDNLDAAYKLDLQSHFANTVAVANYGLRRVDIGDQPEQLVTPTAGGWVGGSGGEQLPESLSAIITWKAFSTFPRTTRSYLFPMTEPDNTATGGIAAVVLSDLNDFAANAITITYDTGVTARKVAVRFGGAPRVVVASNPVTSFAVAGRWRNQRRRRLGVGA